MANLMKGLRRSWIVVGGALCIWAAAVSAQAVQPTGNHADPVAVVIKEAPTAAGFSEGQASAPVVYVFFDPNCAGCHFLYESLRSFVTEGKVQVRWIPVGIVDPTSLGKAAAILQSHNPVAALAYNEKHYAIEDGGIAETIPTARVRRELLENSALLGQLPLAVVPTMLFLSSSGQPMLIQGALSPLALRRVFQHLP